MRRTIAITAGAFFAVSFAFAAYAGPEDISFPVTELGGCESKEACFAYCEDPAHQAVCFEFARANGLMDEKEIEIARRVEHGGGGPGGCQSEEECKAYCEDVAHGDECFNFAVEHELVPPEKREIVRDVLQGNGPGGCRAEKECKTYCDNPAHAEECIAFADKHGLIPEKERKLARKVARDGGPGGCFNEESCRAYCDVPEHLEECVQFAVENEMMDEQEARRVLASGGTGPGGCRGRECKDYCEDPAHAVECVEFGVVQGFIPPEQAELALTVARGGGPGGCRSESECHAYCEEEDHGQECFDFGVRHGLIPPEEQERVRKFMNEKGPGGCRGRACKTYCDEPGHEEECFKFAVEHDLIPPEEQERVRKGIEILREGGPGGCRSPLECRQYCEDSDNEEECFEFGARHDLIPPEDRARREEFKAREGGLLKIVEDQGGPGGCRSKQDCMKYCSDAVNQAECNLFATQNGFTPPARPPREGETLEVGQSVMMSESFEGPGGCTSPQECAEYCKNNKEECMRWRPPGAPTDEGLRRETSESRELRFDEERGASRGPIERAQFCADPENRLECERMKREMRPIRSEEDPRRPDEQFKEDFSGPGGCTSPRACFEYCRSHPEECGEFKEEAREAPAGGSPEDGEGGRRRREFPRGELPEPARIDAPPPFEGGERPFDRQGEAGNGQEPERRKSFERRREERRDIESRREEDAPRPLDSFVEPFREHLNEERREEPLRPEERREPEEFNRETFPPPRESNGERFPRRDEFRPPEGSQPPEGFRSDGR